MGALKTLILFFSLFVRGMNVSADSKSSFTYSSEEVNGMKVIGTVYEMDGSTLANYTKHNYKYDNQNRMTESRAVKWNAVKNIQTNDMCIRYAYQGKSVTTIYYRWNGKKGTYIPVPEMIITMNNPNM